jgi:hypothetical protein
VVLDAFKLKNKGLYLGPLSLSLNYFKLIVQKTKFEDTTVFFLDFPDFLYKNGLFSCSKNMGV